MADTTVITYGAAPNAVTLTYVDSKGVQSETVRDTISGMDAIHVRHTVKVEAVVVFVPGMTVAPSLANETPADTMARIRHLLSLPRRPFTYSVNGHVLLQSDGLDPAGGPMPSGPPSILKVTANSFRVSWEIVVCTDDCAENTTQPLWTSIRWGQEQAIDEANYSTFVTTGRAHFKANGRQNIKHIDDLRGVVVPPAPTNCVRHSRYAWSADGLTLDFSFVDQELYIRPPQDVVKLTGRFVHRFIRGGGKWFAHVSLKLEGAKNVPKPRLMATAIAIAYNRLRKANVLPPEGKGGAFVMEGAFEESFERNTVQVDLSAITAAPNMGSGQSAGQGSGGFWYGFGQGIGGGSIQFVNNANLLPISTYMAATIPVTVQQARDQAQQQLKNATDAPLGLQPIDLNQWGSSLEGCTMPGDTPAVAITPSTYGNYPAFRIIAAAFKDPCLDRATLRNQELADQKNVSNVSPPVKALPATPIVPQPVGAFNVIGTTNIVILNNMPAIPPTGLPSLIDQYPGVYEDYAVRMHWKREENTDVLASTVSGNAGKQVSWANPEIALVVSWLATKWGCPPTVPDPAPKDTNTVLLGSEYDDDDPKLAPDGITRVYGASGWMVYKFLDPTTVNREYPQVPWFPAKLHTLPAPPVEKGVIFPTAAQAQTSTLKSQQR